VRSFLLAIPAHVNPLALLYHQLRQKAHIFEQFQTKMTSLVNTSWRYDRENGGRTGRPP
jgi:hypothetical protein